MDTILYVRQTACIGPDSLEVACNDNDPVFAGGFQSSVTLDVEAGVQYFVVVDSFFAEVNDGQNHYALSSRIGACGGDAIAVCADDADCPFNGTCQAGECVEDVQPNPGPMPGAMGAFFSEYIEGSGNNKAVEIYNPSAEPLNLMGCAVEVSVNGEDSPSRTIALEGADANAPELPASGTWVLCNSQAGDALQPSCNQSSGSLSFNGDDAVSLVCNDVLMDVIGEFGNDPGVEWVVNGTSTLNQTLRRDCAIMSGDDNGNDAFDPSAQWLSFEQDTFDGLGSHCL